MYRKICLSAILAATGFITIAQAETPRDLDDLIDDRASSGERELEDRGYHHRKTIEVNDADLSYWWSSRREQCVVVTTKNGRFKSIFTQPEVMCDESGSNHDYGGYNSSRNDVENVVGMRASSGERELEDLGYEYVNSSGDRDRTWSNWWSDRDRNCITVVTVDGRYDSVVDTLPGDCNRNSHGSSQHVRDEGVTLYRDSHFRGTSLTLYGDESRLSDTRIGTDALSSIRIPRGCEVVLYRDNNFHGRSLKLYDDESDLGRTSIGNNKASSIKVDCR